MLMIIGRLDARSVALSLLVSRSWHGVASSDALWSKKVEGLSKLAAYSLSIVDGKRNRITKEDLWDHTWEFHFNKNTGVIWIRTGKGRAHQCGDTFIQTEVKTADPGDMVWGGHECCYSIVTSFLADGKIREHYVRINWWPRMFISRKEDWGWEMSNHLYCYTSVPDADREKVALVLVFWHAN